MNPNAVIRVLTKSGFSKSTRTGRAGSTTVSSYSTGYNIDCIWNDTRIRTDNQDEAKRIAAALKTAGYTVQTDFNKNFNEVLVITNA